MDSSSLLAWRRSISTVAVAVIVIVIAVVAGVTGYLLLNMSSSTSSGLKSANITVGILPTADAIPFLIAVDQGYFSQEALNITVKYMAGGAVIAPAVAQGSVQIGESSIVGLAASNEQGFNFKFFAPMSVTTYPAASANTTEYVPGVSTHALAVLASSNIHTWKDLVGKTVAINTLGAITQVALDQALANNGVNPSSVNIVAVTPTSWLAELEQGRVDAVDFFEPFATQMIIANQTAPTTGMFRIIGDEMNIGTINQADFFSTQSWINSNPAIVSRFITALDKGIRLANTNVTLDRQMLVKYLNMNPTVASHVNLYSYPMPPIPTSWLQIQIELGLRWGLLKNSNDTAATLVDTNYMPLS
jgi:NitT/TauT family transport system substrate-binding protein